MRKNYLFHLKSQQRYVVGLWQIALPAEDEVFDGFLLLGEGHWRKFEEFGSEVLNHKTAFLLAAGLVAASVGE